MGPAFGTGLFLLVLLCILGLRHSVMLFAQRGFLLEDGRVFYADWNNLGLASFWTSYASYHHLVLRLLAPVAFLVPLSSAPNALSWMALFLTWGVCVWVHFMHLPLVARIGWPLCICLAPLDPSVFDYYT